MITSTPQKSWQETAAAKRASLLASLPSEWLIPTDIIPAERVLDVTTFPQTSGLFTEEELAITGAGATQIIANISKGLWSAEKVASAFCRAATTAHQLVRQLNHSVHYSSFFLTFMGFNVSR